jgi:cell fate regulator YaaT (PSP1 superfamily)
MKYKVGVRSLATNQLRFFDAAGLTMRRGDRVIVESNDGPVIGIVSIPPLPDDQRDEKLHRVLRRASHADLEMLSKNRQKEKIAFEYCEQKIKQLGLEMKLLKVEYMQMGQKIIFYYISEGRVDFRSLVKDLISRFHTRIELRQIGVRDMTKMCGGIGLCGRELCCNKFLDVFESVSVQMLRDQSLTFSPQKYTGCCGRLMCCIAFEQQLYLDARKSLPSEQQTVKTPRGEGIVQDVDVLAGKITVVVGDDTFKFNSSELKPLSPDRKEETD